MCSARGSPTDSIWSAISAKKKSQRTILISLASWYYPTTNVTDMENSSSTSAIAYHRLRESKVAQRNLWVISAIVPMSATGPIAFSTFSSRTKTSNYQSSKSLSLLQFYPKIFTTYSNPSKSFAARTTSTISTRNPTSCGRSWRSKGAPSVKLSKKISIGCLITISTDHRTGWWNAIARMCK